MTFRTLLTAAALVTATLTGPAVSASPWRPDVTINAAPAATSLAAGQSAEFVITVDTPEESEVIFEHKTDYYSWESIETRPIAAGVSTHTFALPTHTPGALTVRFTVVPVEASSARTGEWTFDIAALHTGISMSRVSPQKGTVGSKGQAVTGRVTGGAPRTVNLELSTPGGWTPIASAQTDAAGAYSLTVPTDWVYSGTVRVAAPAAGPYSGAGSSETFPAQIRRAYKPRGRASDWAPMVDGARWDPCKVIDYKVNLTGAPKGALRQVHKAFAIVHEATGLRFTYAGSTTAIPFRTDRGPESSGARFTLAFTSSKHLSAFRGAYGVVGQGGPSWSGNEIHEGGVSVDSDARLRKGFGKGDTWGTLLLHEIGHAIGLDHARGAEQVMHSGINDESRGAYQAGDLTGLRTFGATNGCVAPSPWARLATPRWSVRS